MKYRKTMKEWLTIRNMIDFPPLLTLLVIGSGVTLSNCDCLIPLTINFLLVVPLGIVVCVLSFGVMVWSAVTLKHSNTPMLPHNEAEILVTCGPYRWSRNPIYLADIILLVSSALIYQTLWPVVLLPLLWMILHQRFVMPEEKMLKERFPKAFVKWSERTRRWI